VTDIYLLISAPLYHAVPAKVCRAFAKKTFGAIHEVVLLFSTLKRDLHKEGGSSLVRNADGQEVNMIEDGGAERLLASLHPHF
jgi:hypothetical protein